MIFKNILSNLKYFIVMLTLTACTGSETLSPQPSLVDLDDVQPVCPGLSDLSLSAGPSLSLTWGQGSDNVSQASAITYSVYLRKNTENYDLLSPAKIIIGATSTLITNGIETGSTYTLFVTCKDEAGNSFPAGPQNEKSINVSDVLAPTQISDLVASNPTFTSILLTWSPSDDGEGGTGASAMQYRIYASLTSPVSTSSSALATITGTTSYLHSGLSANQTWYYKVVAVDSLANVSSDSNQATNTTTEDTTAPVFSGNLSSIALSTTTNSSISFSWTAATDNVTATSALTYSIYRCTGSTTCDPFSGAALTTTAAGVVTYSDTGLSASSVYVYGVRARDSRNNLSINTDKLVASTTYSATGSFYSYSTAREMNLHFGRAVAVANIYGAATGSQAFPDLIVGAPNASEAGSIYTNTGCIFIFAGTSVGTFNTSPDKVLCQPSATANGANDRNFGFAIATLDVQGDGHADLVVSSPRQNKIFIIRTQEVSGNLDLGTVTTINSPGATNFFGTGLCVGDSDGVGQPDIFVIDSGETCSTACGGVTGTGNIQIYTNTSSGGSFNVPSLHSRISPSHSIQGLGGSLTNNEQVAKSCAFGKFDPSATTESQLVVSSGTVSWGAGAGNDGVVYFYRKTAANSFTFQNLLRATDVLGTTAFQWGESLAAIQLDSGSSEVIQELVIGAPADNSAGTASGAVYSYRTSTTTSNFSLTHTGETYYGGTDFNSNGAGSGVAAANIWGNPDSQQDLVIGAYLDDNTNVAGATDLNLGDVFTYRNTNGVISSSTQQTNFDPNDMAARVDQRYGFSMCKGDVNNDGYQDVMIGAPLVDYDPVTETRNVDVGQINIYHGKSSGEIDFVNPSQILYAPGGLASSYFGSSCVVMDYNGDSENDLVVGSYNRTVSTAGRGAVFIYYGSEDSDLPNSNSASLNMPGTPATNTYFGYSLAKGDLDNNGAEDLVVSAVGATPTSGFTNAVGRVFVFWGDTTTKAILPGSYTSLQPPKGSFNTAQNTYLTNPQTTDIASFQFGFSLAVFPTVRNSTGKDLVICSAIHNYAASDIFSGSAATTVLGNCWIYEGRVNGATGANFTMMTMPKNEIRYPQGTSGYLANDQRYGSSMTTGRWNSDSVDDLIICARYHRNVTTGTNNSGGCFAFLGRSNGTGGFESYSTYRSNDSGNRDIPAADDFYYNPNTSETSTEFGKSVLLLDINNNGSDDLLVGEQLSASVGGPTNQGYRSGRVFIIRGGY